MAGRYADHADLYVAIIMALPDEDIACLPRHISLEELAVRFPKIYESCVETLRSQVHAKTSNPRAIFTDSSDGTENRA